MQQRKSPRMLVCPVGTTLPWAAGLGLPKKESVQGRLERASVPVIPRGAARGRLEMALEKGPLARVRGQTRVVVAAPDPAAGAALDQVHFRGLLFRAGRESK